jgi:hypothetical protein
MDFQRNTGMYCAENGFSKKYRDVLTRKWIFKEIQGGIALKMDFQRNTGRYCAENGFSKKYREVLARKCIFKEIQGCIGRLRRQ